LAQTRPEAQPAVAVADQLRNQAQGVGCRVGRHPADRQLFALVNVRYLWETGARVRTPGGTLVLAAMLPIPSMKLK
jgi:hypothetical protein